MPASTSTFIQKFLNTYPVASKTLRTTLINSVGNRNPKLYERPKEENVIKVNELLDTLADFENNALADVVNSTKTNQLLKKISQLLNELELQSVRPIESGVSDDWIMFIPQIVDLNIPVKIAAVLVYRFGFIKDRPTDNGPNYTVGNLGLISEHSIADGAESLTVDLFLKCNAKFILANLFKPHTVPNPDNNSPIKYLTDPAHSNTTIFLPILTNLLQKKFPKIPVLIMHGMGDPLGREYQVLMGPCFPRLRNDGWRSFANLLAISFGVEDYFTTPENQAANKPSPVVTVQGYVPNTVLKGGKIIPMSSGIEMTDGALRRTRSAITSNVSGHIRYFASNPFSALILAGYECPDNAIHMETTGFIRNNKSATSATRDKFVQVVVRAMRWYFRYEEAIHDPYRLKQRFIEKSKNMKLYDELFSPTVIARYKLRNSERYIADSAAYQAAFAAKKQLPPAIQAELFLSRRSAPALAIADSVPDNDKLECDYETDNEVQINTEAPNIGFSQLLRFSQTQAASVAHVEEEEVLDAQPKKKQRM